MNNIQVEVSHSIISVKFLVLEIHLKLFLIVFKNENVGGLGFLLIWAEACLLNDLLVILLDYLFVV